jgi:hypothetical protein
MAKDKADESIEMGERTEHTLDKQYTDGLGSIGLRSWDSEWAIDSHPVFGSSSD